jgi:ABC-type phosphate transport system ATPase subunit
MHETVRGSRLQGEILLDGQNILSQDVTLLRRRIGMVFQRPNPSCSALDPISTAKIEELLVSLKDLCTIAIVTHNMQQAARVSDFTAFLLMGQLVEFSPTPQMFTTPSDPRTEAYITGRFG